MSISEHGAYQGWCRVEGIPLRAQDCPSCVRSVRLSPGAWRMLDEIRLCGHASASRLASRLWVVRNGNGPNRAQSMLCSLRDKGLVRERREGGWILTPFGAFLANAAGPHRRSV